MIVRNFNDLDDTAADIKSENWRSKRIILAREGVGFSVHETTLYAGTESEFWYANHIEAVCIYEGEGEIEDLATGEVHQLRPGSVYLLNNHDKHRVRPRTDMKTICVFNPPVTGREVHDEHGVYPLVTEAEAAAAEAVEAAAAETADERTAAPVGA